MNKKDYIVALIPLRSGSKTIPWKNIKVIAGKPLCVWCLNAVFESNIFDRVIVSTDSDKIADIAKQFHPDVQIIMRPAALATDNSSTESVMLHTLELIDFDIIFTVQATSPLIESRDIISAYNQFKKNKYDSLLTGVKIKKFIWSIDGKPLNYNPQNRPRRQDFDGVYIENGAFYITKKDILKRYKCRLGGGIGIYQMSEYSSVDIDDLSDWEIAQKRLLERKRNTRHKV